MVQLLLSLASVKTHTSCMTGPDSGRVKVETLRGQVEAGSLARRLEPLALGQTEASGRRGDASLACGSSRISHRLDMSAGISLTHTYAATTYCTSFPLYRPRRLPEVQIDHQAADNHHLHRPPRQVRPPHGTRYPPTQRTPSSCPAPRIWRSMSGERSGGGWKLYGRRG